MSDEKAQTAADGPSIVTVLPTDVEIEVGAEETVMAAAQRAGYKWPTLCGGEGTCRTCYLEVREGQDSCSEIAPFEREGIDALKKPDDGVTRLACQLRVSGDVTVFKRGVRPAKRS